jgi:N-acetylmannosamine-6-phosphate 2-epimerase/N-acetylmannosamine kinase
LAEGRYQDIAAVRAALAIGAAGVVIGGAINDPAKQTRHFLGGLPGSSNRVGAVDIGGTWLRFGLFEGDRVTVERIPLPAEPRARLAWIAERAAANGVERIGVSTGGVVDPRDQTVIEAKPIIPGHVGTRFDWVGLQSRALNDGLATAWGHAWHPRFAGRAVATLALGTGVGCGMVREGRLLMGKNGDYPRLNDLPVEGGHSFEDLLGGASLSPDPSPRQQEDARLALRAAVRMMRALWQPEAIVVCGGVGLAPWLRADLPALNLEPSPYGEDAGLWGARALALMDPLA